MHPARPELTCVLTAVVTPSPQVNANVFLKATKVDGVYDSDPMKNPDARRYDRLSYRQVRRDILLTIGFKEHMLLFREMSNKSNDTAR